MISSARSMRILSPVLRFFYYSHFWIWNLLFCGVALFGIIPHILVECTVSMVTGELPVGIYLGVIGLCIIPFCSLVIGVKYASDGALLFRYFYGVEIPLMVLLCLRGFILKQNPFSADLFLWLCALTIAYLAYTLFFRASEERSKFWEVLPQSILLWASLTLSSIGFLYALPFLVQIVQGVYKVLETENFFELFGSLFLAGFYVLLFGGFASFTIIIFFIAPPAFLFITFSTCRQYIKESFFPSFRATITCTVALLLSLGIYGLSQVHRAPDYQKIAQLGETAHYSGSSDRELNALKSQLTNAYLNRYRYPLHSESLPFTRWFNRLAGTDVHWISTPWNQTFSYLVSPFIYPGGANDSLHAERAYKNIFDTDIQKAERPHIRKAIEAHYERTETEAGLLELEERNVSVIAQTLTVEDHGGWAQVELYERYENNTFSPQESFYYFSLPPHAALSGLYLGNTPDKDEAFRYRVSPRGAAQAVYKEQKRRRVDPALLEQVGPRQYRLRVFPIPQKTRERGSINVETPHLHLWMEIQVRKVGSQIPLPTLLEKRNTEFSKKAARSSNRETSPWGEQQWLPRSVEGLANPAPLSELSLAGHTLSLRENDSVVPSQVCIIIDGSYSMLEQQEALIEALKTFPDSTALDLYLASHNSTRLHSLSAAENAHFIGCIELSEILNQYLASNLQEHYDTVIIITDEGGYEVSTNAPLTRPWAKADGALHLLHLGGHLAPAYSDSVLDAITVSSGGVGTHWNELPDWKDHTWHVESSSASHPAPLHQEGTPIRPQPHALAAKILIESTSTRGNTTLQELKKLHALARTYHVVTPYSSMIVLVNQAQHRQLDEAEKKADRFKRETDTGVEQIRANRPSTPFGLDNGSVPEPSPLILLLLTACSSLLIRHRA